MDFANNVLQSFIPGVANAQQGNYASQVFSKRLAAVDYTLQWQQLHREDIRDLMQLTVGRMDIYQLVGTLLLTFGIGWYTDNQLLSDKKLPFGFVLLFLISNFCAVGYLLISVLLAMHASIAAQSVGTRLLTSFTRLSIPSRKELDAITVSVSPLVDTFLNMGKGALERVLSGARNEKEQRAGRDVVRSAMDTRPDQDVQEEGKRTGKDAVKSALDTMAAWKWSSDVRRREEAAQGALAEDCDVDPTKHFQRYSKEQQSWLAYDAYARTCLALGVNQLLQALAYYVVGTIAQISYVAAFTSFLSVKLLAVLLLKLDLRGESTRREKILVFSTFVLPPLLAALVIWLPEEVDMEARDLLTCPCFVLHAIWSFYIAHEIKPTPPLGASEGQDMALLPRRLRSVQYLCVLNPRQREAAARMRKEGPGEQLKKLRDACEDLRKEMKNVEGLEKADATLSCKRRDALAPMCRRLEDAMDVVHRFGGASRREFLNAQRLLDFTQIWQKTPELLASLQALRQEGVQAWLEEYQKIEIEACYQAFLQRCKELQLGVLPDDDSTSPLQVDPGDTPVVRLDTYWDSMPQQVWLDSQAPVSCSKPKYKTATSMHTGLEIDLPSWHKQADHVQDKKERRRRHEGVVPQAPEAHENLDETQSASSETAPAQHLPSSVVPVEALPPDQLPGQLVRSFTLFTASWWLFIGFAYALMSFLRIRPVDDWPSSQALRLEWPEPANFIEVTGLRCTGKQLLVSTPYATFGTAWPQEEKLDLELMASNWSNSLADVQLPRAWRAISDDGGEPLQVAGWDGSSVVIARLKPAGHLEERFAVRPELGRCPASGTWSEKLSGGTCKHVAKSFPRYDDVTALHISRGASFLLVLLGSGHIDAWNLRTGELLGRWKLPGGSYSALCHDGFSSELLLARRAASQPELLLSQLPKSLKDLVLGDCDGAKMTAETRGVDRSSAVLVT